MVQHLKPSLDNIQGRCHSRSQAAADCASHEVGRHDLRLARPRVAGQHCPPDRLQPAPVQC